uniref:Uncharacterized protein n=1 Tax=Cannabis sativa TaxID=3483 RepID=A0A803P1V8_CANSA
MDGSPSQKDKQFVNEYARQDYSGCKQFKQFSLSIDIDSGHHRSSQDLQEMLGRGWVARGIGRRVKGKSSSSRGPIHPITPPSQDYLNRLAHTWIKVPRDILNIQQDHLDMHTSSTSHQRSSITARSHCHNHHTSPPPYPLHVWTIRSIHVPEEFLEEHPSLSFRVRLIWLDHHKEPSLSQRSSASLPISMDDGASTSHRHNHHIHHNGTTTSHITPSYNNLRRH